MARRQNRKGMIMDNALEQHDRQQTEHDRHYGDDAPSTFEDGIAKIPANQTESMSEHQYKCGCADDMVAQCYECFNCIDCCDCPLAKELDCCAKPDYKFEEVIEDSKNPLSISRIREYRINMSDNHDDVEIEIEKLRQLDLHNLWFEFYYELKREFSESDARYYADEFMSAVHKSGVVDECYEKSFETFKNKEDEHGRE